MGKRTAKERPKIPQAVSDILIAFECEGRRVTFSEAQNKLVILSWDIQNPNLIKIENAKEKYK